MDKADFSKILIANRGEIAIRIMRAATELGKRTIAVYAEEDKLSLHRFKADEAYQIGAGMTPVGAYLSIPEIIRVAKQAGADAIHPGYGLLSENPDFVEACDQAGIVFIGPKAETMRALGDKASARRVAVAAGVPVIPATEVLGDDFDLIKKHAAEVGYPLMLKASWGGGGRGMRAINGPDDLVEKVLEGRREAQAAFGNGEGYLEKMILRARHVEVQILGDKHNAIYHLFERDCTVQRRNQKVVERAPAPYLTEAQRQEICELGRKICAHVNCECAGTVEFLMDIDTSQFYFIEVNPRVQVEHTVTEEVTGIDIVQAQIQIAEGATLAEATGAASKADVKLRGHAIQCRITALAWKDAPEGTKSFAIFIHDPDAKTGGAGFWHWAAIDIPATTMSMQQGAGNEGGKLLPAGAKLVASDFGEKSYVGPCPPQGDAPHHYVFTVYALKVAKLELPENPTASLTGFMTNANALGNATLTATYGR